MLTFDQCMHSRMHLCLVQQLVASLSVRISGWQLPEGLILPVRTQHTLFTYRHTHTQTAKPTKTPTSHIHFPFTYTNGLKHSRVSHKPAFQWCWWVGTTWGAYTMRKYLCQSSSTRETKAPCSHASRSLSEGIMLRLRGSSIKGALCKNQDFTFITVRLKVKSGEKSLLDHKTQGMRF